MLIRQGEKKENFRFIENDVRNFEMLKVLRLRQQRSGDRSPVADDKGTMIFLFSDGRDAVHLTFFFIAFTAKGSDTGRFGVSSGKGEMQRTKTEGFCGSLQQFLI